MLSRLPVVLGIPRVAIVTDHRVVPPRRAGHGQAAAVTSSLEAGFQNSLLTRGRKAIVQELS